MSKRRENLSSRRGLDRSFCDAAAAAGVVASAIAVPADVAVVAIRN